MMIIIIFLTSKINYYFATVTKPSGKKRKKTPLRMYFAVAIAEWTKPIQFVDQNVETGNVMSQFF